MLKSKSLGGDVRQAKGLIVHVRMLQKIRSTGQDKVTSSSLRQLLKRLPLGFLGSSDED